MYDDLRMEERMFSNLETKPEPSIRIFSYNGWPTNDMGRDGDFFIDELDNMLYGPKADGAWPEDGVPASGVCKRNFFGMYSAPLRTTSRPLRENRVIHGIKALLRFLLGVRNSPVKV